MSSHNINYLTLKDIDQDQKNPVFEYLKKLVPSVFQDGILNFDLLKQHLNPNEKIIQNTRNFLGLDWATKEKAKLEYSKNVKNKTLLPNVNRSLNFDQAKNIIIEGDNLEALKILQSSYQEQVDVIYIDPPYNTGNDFVYNDNFKQDSYEYKLANGLIDEEGLKTTTNQKTNPRLHNNWLDMIYPRLKVARNLLKKDGVIFISIDDNEQARLKLICDEIFGEENFITNFIWERTYHSNKNSSGKKVFKNCDYILAYSKDKDALIYFNEGIKTDFEDAPLKNNSNIEKEFIFPKNSIFFKKDNSWNNEEVKITFKSRWSQEKIDSEILNGTKFIIKNDNYDSIRALYNSDKTGFLLSHQLLNTSNVYNNNYLNATTERGTKELNNLNILGVFDYPKPKELLKYFINLNLNKNSLVLDFFAGSGTTAQAVMELNQEDGGNRKYILVQLPEPIENNPEFKTICDITRARITRSIEKYQYNDLGFKYFKIGKSNFPIWQVQTDDSDKIIESQLNVFESLNSNQNYESMLYELMIREGMRFDENIQLHQIHDYQFWADEFFNYLFFLEPTNPNNLFQVIKQIIENKEQEGKTRIYINEAYFDDLKGDEMKLNLAEQISQYKKEIQLVVV